MPRREAALNGAGLALPRMIRPEYQSAIVASVCFAVCAVWPASAVFSAVIAFAAFCAVLFSYKLPGLPNLAFVFLCFTLIIILSDSILWNVVLGMANLPSGENNDTRNWAIQYIAMAIDAMVLGACLVTSRHHDTRKPSAAWSSRIHCPWIYLTAAFVPLLLNLILYYFSLRGLDYVEIHEAGLGPEKYILFLVLVTHAAFMRLFGGWPYLGGKSRWTLAAAVCLFLYIYVFLMPLRSNLFIFGMYSFYFLGRQVRWRRKVALLAGGIVLFSWIAVHRSGTEDALREMGPIQATASALSFGTGMVDMVPWAYDEVESHGRAWGATYLLELAHSENAPSVRYVREQAPMLAETGGGLGFFYVAELLLNFGYLGGLLGACILGMALQKLSTMQAAVVRSTVLPALLGASFLLIRNDFMTTLKVPLYMIIVCFILDRAARFCLDMSRRIKLANLSEATKQHLAVVPIE
jgi:hypothetical protein